MIRAVSGALPATWLLLLGSFLAPSAVLATDVRCDRASSLTVPSERLKVRIVDLSTSDDEASGAELGRAFNGFRQDSDLTDVIQESEGPVPDLSSRARSLAILREIFGETVGNDTLDVARVPAHDLPPGTDGKVTLRRPTAELSENDLPTTGVSASEDAETNAAEADLPGVSDEESLRYRRQMYRTDI